MDNKPSFSGKLSFISLADIFQILGGNSSTGTLKISSQYTPNPGQIFFVNGNPANAICDRLSGLEAIYSLFGWLHGEFEFYEGKIHQNKAIEQSRMEIVLDALRMLDDGDIKKIGPPAGIDDEKEGKSDALPIIKGPLQDYSFIVGEDEFDEGKTIVKEGRHGKWIWVLLEGMADVIRETPEGPMTVSRLGEGSFIGTFTALLFGEYARQSSVKAVGKVCLGLIDTERLSREFNSRSPEFRSLLLSLDRRLRLITDRVADLYISKKEDFLLPKNSKVVIEKGSSEQNIFYITEGTAFVVASTPKGNLPLVKLGKDEVFGNLPFLDIGNEPRSASVLASKDLKVEKIDPEGLQKEYDELSGTFRGLMYNVATCISLTSRMAYHLWQRKKGAK